MSASPTPTTTTPPLSGTHAPSQIEFLWERYRKFVWVVVAAIAVALAANYIVKNVKQRAIDAKWSAFATATELDNLYANPPTGVVSESLAEQLRNTELAELEAALAASDDAQKPFLLLAIARKATMESQWDRAESALNELANKYPNHSLVQASDYPVQVREPLDEEEPKSDKPAPAGPEKLKPAKSGSAVTVMRAELAASRAFAAPAQFAKVPVPADAKKVRFELSTGGSFVIALMPQAPKHVESFLKLAAENEGFWKGMAVDEIQRPTDRMPQPRAMHLGFESTRNEDDRSKWVTTDPSKHVLDFETNELSHYAGAVSGRPAAEGKSSADRFWIVADDAARFDGERVVFGYVVEGLDVVKRVTEESMSAQEEQAGRGKPAVNIRVTAVTVE